MNIFEEYKNKILTIIKNAEKDKLLTLPENLNGINVDSTPPKIDFDLSTNVSMVLSKPNNKPPSVLAETIISLLKKYSTRIKKIDSKILIYQMVRDSINLMVKDLIKNSLINFKVNKIKKLENVYKSENKLVCFSTHYESIIDEIRDFLSLKMYKNNKVLKKNIEGKRIIEKLFKVISNNPRKFLTFLPIKHNKYRSIADYISGMTDRFAINIYKSIK